MKLKKALAMLVFAGSTLSVSSQKDVPTTYTDIPIPSKVMALNNWMPDYYITYSTTPLNGVALLHNIQTMVDNVGATRIRIGGKGYDSQGIAVSTSSTSNDYLRAIGKVREISPNATFIIQIPYRGPGTSVGSFTFTASDTKTLVTNIKNAYPSESFYYAIGNEWDGYAPASNTAIATMVSDFKAHATEIKKIDPNAKILSPQGTSYYAPYTGTPYIMSLITPTTNGNSICGFISGTGTGADGKPFCDIVDFHAYPGGSSGSMSNGTAAITATQYTTWRSDMDSWPQGSLKSILSNTTFAGGTYTGIQKLINDAGRGSGTSFPMTIALSEMNITAKNPTLTSQSSTNPYENTFEGIACRSFFAGQWWMETFCSFIINSGGMAEFVSPWSIHEKSGDGSQLDLSMTRGSASSSTDPTRGATYHHYEMLADNIRNCDYLKNPYSNNTTVKAFGAYNTLNGGPNTKYVMVLINQGTVDVACGLTLDTYVPLGNAISFGFPGNIMFPGAYSYTVNANSTHVLVWNDEGDILRKVVYKQSDGSTGLPAYTHYTPGNGNYAVMTELGPDQSQCCGGVTLTAQPAIPSATYTWYSSASNFTTSIQSGSSNSYVVPVGTNRTFKCVVTYSGQTAWDYVKGSVSSVNCCKPTGLAENGETEDNSFFTMPNPTDDKTTIKYQLPENIRAAKIDITDVSGKLIKSIAITSENTIVEVDCRSFSSGVYFYSLNVNGTILKTKKLIVVK